jgi:hypothetical protein
MVSGPQKSDALVVLDEQLRESLLRYLQRYVGDPAMA